MSEIDTGGTAFPMQDPQAIHAYAASAIQHIPEDDTEARDRAYMAARAQAIGGLSVRDYFATNIITPPDVSRAWGEVMVRPFPKQADGISDAHFGLETILWWADVDAAWRYVQADAMMKARKA